MKLTLAEIQLKIKTDPTKLFYRELFLLLR